MAKITATARKQLIDLYKIPTHTTSEEMKEYMMDAIPHYDWVTDDYGNLYGTYHASSSKVVLSSHLDMVKTGKDIAHVINCDGILFGADKDLKPTSLGADDKNGLWCIIRASKHPSHPNIVLFMDEEIGRKGSLACNIDWFKDKDCCIVIDRRGHHEIIIDGMRGQYSSMLGACFKSVNPDWNYEEGAGCDADSIKHVIDCINISCGYYNAHTANEFTILNELEETYDAIARFLDKDWSGLPWKEIKAQHKFRFIDNNKGYNHGFNY